jgi:hypothetical protein
LLEVLLLLSVPLLLLLDDDAIQFASPNVPCETVLEESIWAVVLLITPSLAAVDWFKLLIRSAVLLLSKLLEPALICSVALELPLFESIAVRDPEACCIPLLLLLCAMSAVALELDVPPVEESADELSWGSKPLRRADEGPLLELPDAIALAEKEEEEEDITVPSEVWALLPELEGWGSTSDEVELLAARVAADEMERLGKVDELEETASALLLLAAVLEAPLSTESDDK